MPDDPFQQLEQAHHQGGTAAVLEQLVNQLRREERYHELFEALKMQVRHRLGLPLLYGEAAEELDESQRRCLEDGLLEACREVGQGLLRQGALREGWMYLRAVGEREVVADQLRDVSAQENNLEELIEILLHEGVDPQRGFSLVLEHYGTCNAITTFESVMPRHRRAQQEQAARLLLEHLHAELLANVAAHVQQQEGEAPAETRLADLVAEREWLFGEHSYHLDTTHLASVVRFARLLRGSAQLQLALDLTHYGRRLSKQFQYPGDEPFKDFYPSSALFFAAQLGQQVDEALEYFRQKAETLDVRQHGSVAIEVYVDLLARVGRTKDAMDVSIRMIEPGTRTFGIGPSLLELSQQAGDYGALQTYCRNRGDVLGFATALVEASRRV